MNIGRNIGPQYLVGSVRTPVQEPLYYVIDIFYFLSNTCKYFSLVERKWSYSPLVYFYVTRFYNLRAIVVNYFMLNINKFDSISDYWNNEPY